jgi:hypothetical protein
MTAAMEPGARWDAAKALAQRLVESGSLEMPTTELEDLQPHIRELVERGVLLEERGKIRFFHQNFLDYVFARDFAERGSSLAYYVRQGQQDLRLRATVRRVLEYQRAEDHDDFIASAEQLLSADIRFFIKDVVFSLLQQDDQSAPSLWPILRRLVLDPRAVGHEAAWQVVAQPGWSRSLDASGEILRWMASEDERERDAAVGLLRTMQSHDSERVARLLTPFIGLLDWDARLRSLIRFSDAHGERPYFDLILRALREGAFDDDGDHAQSELWLAVHELPTARPEWAVEFLDVYLQRHGRQRLFAAAENRFRFGDRDHWSADFATQTATGAPRAFANVVLPVVLDVVNGTAGEPDSDGVRRDPLWVHQTVNERDAGFVDGIYYALDSALRSIARRSPRSFARFEATLVPLANYHSATFLLFRAWSANPRRFWRQAISLLTENATSRRCGYIDSPYWVTRELIASIQRYADASSLAQLERALLSFYPAWEKSHDGHAASGHAQYVLLSAFDPARLTNRGKKRLRELQDKFREDIEKPQAIIDGWVGSPISDEAAARMSDRQWLNAINKYVRDESREFLKGGAVELSRVLERRTQEDPHRFAALTLQFPDSANENYFDAALRGLADSERDIAPQDVFEVIRRVFSIPAKPGGRWIARPLARVAEAVEVPGDVVDIVVWYATKHPDPEQELARVEAGSSGPYYGDDLLTAGINSVRGSAAQALAYVLWRKPEYLPRLKSSLETLVRDPVLAVRACAAWTVAAVARHDVDLGLALFTALVDADDEILAAQPVEELLRVLAHRRLDAVRPTLVRMLRSPVGAVQQAGGRQAALAHLTAKEAADLTELALHGPASTRSGVAEVAAHNITNADVGNQCARWLEALFSDPDPSVREMTTRWCMQLEGGDLNRLLDLARAYVETPAHAEHEHALLHALDEAADVPIADLALRAAEVFVEQHGGEITDIRRRAALDASTVSKLAFRAYASAESTGFLTRCLDVIDRLLAARVHDVEHLVKEFEVERV